MPRQDGLTANWHDPTSLAGECINVRKSKREGGEGDQRAHPFLIMGVVTVGCTAPLHLAPFIAHFETRGVVVKGTPRRSRRRNAVSTQPVYELGRRIHLLCIL